nr:MAG TPA: Sigma factor AlgU negative regulatory factor, TRANSCRIPTION.96A [Caudoviricetes sp.]
MIDPNFERRLANWSRYIRGGNGHAGVSATYQAMAALRLYGPNAPAEAESRDAPGATTIDVKDAEKLCAAYAGPWLTPQEKKALRLKYGRGLSDMTCARRIRVGYRFFLKQFEAIVRKFQRIVETNFDEADV